MQFNNTSNWLVGDDGSDPTKDNVCIGARVGLFFDSGCSSMHLRHNYLHHIYFGGWSQGACCEQGAFASMLVEHCIIMGGSWPNRYVGGEFRYNLVMGFGNDEGLVWTNAPNGYVHHCVFYAYPGRGQIFDPYTFTGIRLLNNTFDGANQDQSGANSIWQLFDGGFTGHSNLFYRGVAPGVSLGGATVLDADYNGFFLVHTPFYSDSRTPAHDINGSDPKLTNPLTTSIAYDESQVWKRTLTVSQILAVYRTRYTPLAGSPLLGAGDPNPVPGNFIGAIGNGSLGTDLFGTT